MILDVTQRTQTNTTSFRITKEELCKVAYACQERIFAEEIDNLEELGGEQYLESALCTNYKNGLQMNDVEQREHNFGHNRKPILKSKTYCELLWSALEDFTMRILCLASLISIAVDVGTASSDYRAYAWIEGFAILVAVIISTNANAINDYQKEKQFQKLNSVADERKRVTVIRNSVKCDIHMSEVLVGDIMLIFEGMEIPADGLILEASELTTDESAMTGETDPIKKNLLSDCIQKRNQTESTSAGHHDVPSPILMSGTRVLTGEGKMLILVVGDLSCAGKIGALLRQDEQEQTPLQVKLTAIAEDIGKFGLISAIVIVVVMCIRFAVEKSQVEWENKYIVEIINYFIIGITVVVVAIPEGLPLAVTLSLAYSTKQMLTDQNLVRKMAACETMGGASMICSDKTGTLTQNKMTLVNLWNDSLIELEAYNNCQISDYLPTELAELFIQSAIVNSNAMLKPEPKGSKTEIAFLQFLERCQIPYEQQRDKYQIKQKFPFSSQRKRMSIIIENDKQQYRLVTKGASEMVLAGCTHFHSKQQGIIKINKQQIEEAIENMAKRALRTICLAYKDFNGNIDQSKDEKGVYSIETNNLILIAVLGIKDIIRQEVPKAIQLCKTAGIKVRMVTGDNISTAKAIAKECGIITSEDSIVMEGPEFIRRIGGVVCKNCHPQNCDCARDSQTAEKENKKVRIDTIANGEEFDKIYPELDVLARSRPEDKYALVTGLIERGHVVAVTGDGTNDAPALKKADVGFAMGVSGTEVAREAAAIILLDDNFNSIVKAVMWGRNVYDNIKKFLRFQLTANLVSVSLTLIGAAVLRQEVLRPIQLLWVNLIMDTLGSLALATEPPTEKLLNRKPHDRNEYIISKKMFKFIAGTALIQVGVVLIIVFLGDSFLPEYQDAYDNNVFSGTKIRFKYSNHNCITSFEELQLLGQTKLNYTSSTDNTDDADKCLLTECVCKNDECYKILCPQCQYTKDSCSIVASGRLMTVSGENDYYVMYNIEHEGSRHFTYVFNVFIMLQLFNFLNSRRITDEINILDNISNHSAFLMIVPFIFCIQILMVTFGSSAIGLYGNYGLQIKQWLIGIAFGSISLIACLILKFVPEDKFCSKLDKTNKVIPMETNPTNVICSIPEHQEVDQKIIHLCLDSKCQISKKSLCGLCLGEEHYGHKSINLQTLDSLIKNEWTREIKHFNQKNKDLTDSIQLSIGAIINKVKFIQEQVQIFATQEMQDSKVGILKKKYIDQQNLTEKDFEQLAKDVGDIIYYTNGVPDFKPIDFEPSDKFQSLANRLVFDASLFCKDISIIQKSPIIHQSFQEQIMDLLFQINTMTNLIERPLSQLVQSRRIFANDRSETQSLQKIDFDNQSIFGTVTQSPFSIQKFVKLKSLEQKGFAKIYDELFNKPFTQTHIELIKQRCTPQSQICIGGVSINEPDQYILCATDYAYEFYTETQDLKFARKSRNGEVFWYYVRNRCVGFSPMSKIDLRYPDVDNEEGDLRFSLWLFHGQGGYRIGRLESLEQSVDYKQMIQNLSFLSVQYCPIDFEDTITFEIEEQQQLPKENTLTFRKQSSCKILQPIFQFNYDPMEVEREQEIIQQIIDQQPSPINLAFQFDLDEYFAKINLKLTREHLLNNSIRNKYLDVFEKDSIQRKQCSTLELLVNLFKSSYKEFMNSPINHVGIIKIFIEDNIDAFITGSLFPPQQEWHDYKIMILAIIIKIMRIKSTTGQLIYESMVAYLYEQLSCVFKNTPPNIPEFKDYFEWYFWQERNKVLEINPLTENEKKSIRIVSIIRKYSCLLWSLLWIDPNLILSLNPDLKEFREQEKIPAYRFLNKDRQIFSLLILKLVQCNTFAFVPALNALFDVVQDKTILLPIFSKFDQKLNDEYGLKELLEPLGPLKQEAIKEFFNCTQVHDEGLVQIVKGKLKHLKGEQSQSEIDFYEKLFQNDQRPTFYQD